MRRFVLVFACLSMGSTSSFAAASGDWPCVQRKVPQISLPAVWTMEPPGEDAAKLKDSKEITDLVSYLAARRVPLPEAEKAVNEFAANNGPDKKAKLGALFLSLFDKLNAERSDVIAGIERYGRKQIQLADNLRKEQEALSLKRADAKADPSEIQDLTDQLTWNTRIFEERRKSLTYVCEVPVIIEQRLFDLAKTIQAQLK
jgi:hypothetical protein